MKTVFNSKNKKIVVRGSWAGLSATYISILFGRRYAITRKILYNYGKSKNNTLTIETLAELIFEQRRKKRIKEIRERLALIRGSGGDNPFVNPGSL